MAYKRTSELLNIGAALDAVDGTPTSVTVTLPLSSLDREIFVVTDIQLDTERLNAQAAPGFAALSASVNKTSTSALTINNANCLGSTAKSIETTALGYIYQQSRQPDESSTGQAADFIGIIATPNFVLAANFVTTAGGASNRAVYARVTGFRAKADADTYSALLTEEINQ